MMSDMSFEDLPADWPSHPLDDASLASDVLDLCVSSADRRTGGLAVLVLRPDLTLAQPIFVAGAMPTAGRAAALSNLFTGCAQPGATTSFLVGIVHQRSALSDADRSLHQQVIEVTRQLGHTLVSTHLVTASAIDLLPAARAAA